MVPSFLPLPSACGWQKRVDYLTRGGNFVTENQQAYKTGAILLRDLKEAFLFKQINQPILAST